MIFFRICKKIPVINLVHPRIRKISYCYGNTSRLTWQPDFSKYNFINKQGTIG